MVGLLEQHDRQGSRPGGKLVDHSSWQGWAPNASPNSRPLFNWGTSVVPIRYKCDGMDVPGVGRQHTWFGLGLGNRPLVWTSWGCLAVLQFSKRAQTRHREAQKVLAVKPLPVACQLPSFVGSQGIF